MKALNLGNTINSLTGNEKRTFGLHLGYSVFEGILFGAFLMNEFVFLKSLHGNSYMLGLLFVFSMAVFTLLIFGSELLKRNPNKQKLLRTTAIVTRLPLLAFIFFPVQPEIYSNNIIWHFAFLSIFLLFYLGTPITYPTINLLLRNNYRIEIFGKLFGYANSVNKLFAFIATFVFGWLLESNYGVFRYVYPVCGIVGLASLWCLSSIPYVEVQGNNSAKGFFKAIKNSVSMMTGILKTNRPYLNFELGFLVYGFGFMITVTVITIYLEKSIGLSYLNFAAYRNYGAIITILLMPVFSRFIDKIDPRRFARICYSMMLFYVLFIMLSNWFPQSVSMGLYKFFPTLFVAFTFLGLFNASMGLLWYIGSSYYCKDNNRSGDYQSVHLSFVGIRAMIAPLLGVFIYETFGFMFTFGIAIVILIFAISMTYYSQYKNPVL